MATANQLLSQSIIQILRFYRYFISPMLGQCCRFHPSCADYSQIAFENFGAVKGIGLTIRRLLKCHPFHEGGFDPVPKNTSGSDA